jgi:hypothetical protein
MTRFLKEIFSVNAELQKAIRIRKSMVFEKSI